MHWLLEPLSFAFMRSGLLAAMLVGIACAAIGVYVVMRRMAFIGDALSHTILPGVVIAYLNQWNLFVGALIAGVLTAIGISWVSRRDAIREDTAIGVLFTAMFAAGILLMSSVRSFRDFSHILFGNILGVTSEDLALIALIGALILITLFLFHKELGLTSYDAIYAQSIGIHSDRLRTLLLILLALTVVTSIQVVGVVLTSALLVTPAAAASLVTQRLSRMMLVAGAIAVSSSVVGLYASYYAAVSSGAAIVLACTFFFGVAWVVRTIRGG
ncbi:MAG TPA: metal ABC transporter permease [Roseiflexaceae bacterium]|nr:metal ABC transporter permease [Roseiflexaceae bacterium]HMP39790.1 metal ABC transporter permease [Roseiflexaceae bacterium]